MGLAQAEVCLMWHCNRVSSLVQVNTEAECMVAAAPSLLNGAAVDESSAAITPHMTYKQPAFEPAPTSVSHFKDS